MSAHNQKIDALAQVLGALLTSAAGTESVPTVRLAPAIAPIPGSGPAEPEKKKRRYRKPKPDPSKLPDFACVTHDMAASIVSLSPATLKRLVAQGTGPPRVQVSERRVAYRISDLRVWAASRPAA
jgi:predicted DNA-binding transcriptional regulator AlpA